MSISDPRSSVWISVPDRSAGGEHRAAPASCRGTRSSTAQPSCCRKPNHRITERGQLAATSNVIAGERNGVPTGNPPYSFPPYSA